jgi:hypothetical protein
MSHTHPCYSIIETAITKRAPQVKLLTQEIKQDMIFQRMNLPPSARRVTEPQQQAAHLNSTIRRLHSYLQYIGLAKYGNATKMLQRMMEVNLEEP